MTEKVRLAVVGLNNQGREHIAAIDASGEAELVALCDTRRDLLEATEPGRALARYDDIASLCADPRVEGIAAALPHHLHAKSVALAAEHGKHLLKEKPLGRHLREAHELAELARLSGIVLHTGVQRRHHESYRFLKEAIVGQTVRAASLSITINVGPGNGPPPEPTWRDDFHKAGGGVLIDLGYHGVDLVHYLLGPLQLLSCVTSSDGLPCSAEAVESEARLHALAGRAWVRMFFARIDRKRESLVLETERGTYEAGRDHVSFEPWDGPRETLFEGDRSWCATLDQQLRTFCAAIRSGARGANDLGEQIPTLRFIERCYALRRPQGL